ncbi:MAG: 50S ribosomal protein L30 [Clostridiales bacterium]|nr:50S ribosomal protein L30 [Clostridiales bacterium]
MANLNIKLVRSVIGTLPKQRKTIEALGLKKIGQEVQKPDNPQTRGMVEVVKHLVEVTEA